ncbi:MAG: ornithine carbamoyltransferase [Acidobacteriaceae bacterium]
MTTKSYAMKSFAITQDSPISAPPSELANTLAGRDLCSIRDLSAADVQLILDTAHAVKARPELYRQTLSAKQLVMFFEKDSLRTRMTFEAGINTLGGSAIFIDQKGSRLGERETLADVAHNLERWVDVIVLRTYSHETITEMARYARVPVVNALSDIEHPCQSLADIFTLQERFGDLRGLRLAYVGDGNNVAHSLLLTAVLTGANITLASPKGYEPKAEFLAAAEALAAGAADVPAGAVTCVTDPSEAVSGADAVYTDQWTSMGQESEADQRQQIFASYQVNSKMMSLAAPHGVFMHCLPARRGNEVTDEVIDSAQSVVFDQAENRMHVQKAILLLLLDAARDAAPLTDLPDSRLEGVRPFTRSPRKRATQSF